MKCTLCEDPDSAGELVHDFGQWALYIHPDWAVRGHALLIVRRHLENFAELTESEAAEFARAQSLAERALLDLTGTERVILLKLGIQTPHFHMHLYPVSAAVDREGIMAIIDCKTRETVEPEFAATLRDRLLRLT